MRPGKSSPVLTRRHVFLTALENGKLFTQSFDRETGKLLWERSVDRARVEPAHTLNHSAAITPVTDGEMVYVFFPEYGLLAYDADGKERWKAPLGPFSNENGHSSCPIIAGDNVILVLDQMVGSFIAAFDRRNGELRWKTPREEMDGYATPLLHNGGFRRGWREILTGRRAAESEAREAGVEGVTAVAVEPEPEPELEPEPGDDAATAAGEHAGVAAGGAGVPMGGAPPHEWA